MAAWGAIYSNKGHAITLQDSMVVLVLMSLWFVSNPWKGILDNYEGKVSKYVVEFKPYQY